GKTFKAHRYCCLGIGDKVTLESGRVKAVCRNGSAIVRPTYRRSDFVALGRSRIEFIVKEIETQEEFSAYHKLEQYHYRGLQLHGRRTPLICRSLHPSLPFV